MQLNPALKVVSLAAPRPETPRQMLARIQAMREERETLSLAAAAAEAAGEASAASAFAARAGRLKVKIAIARQRAKTIRFDPHAEHAA